MRVPEEAVRRAWAHALRHPTDPTAATDARQAVRLADGAVLTVRIDEDPSGRFARVSLHRDDPPLLHAEAVTLASEAFVLGRFEPFPVDSVPGSDGRTHHFVIALCAYKNARAVRLQETARAMLGAGASEEEWAFAARQIACPFAALAASCDLDKAARKDERTRRFLSDRFLVPEAWIEEQIEDFFRALRDGDIDRTGHPREPEADG